MGKVATYGTDAACRDSILSFLTGCHFIENPNPCIGLVSTKLIYFSGNKILQVSKIANLQHALKTEEIDLQNVFDRLLQLSVHTNELTVHLILHAIYCLNRLSPNLIKRTAESMSRELLMLYYKYYKDPVIGGVLVDLFIQIIKTPGSGSAFLKVFIPNMKLAIRDLIFENFEGFSFAEQEGRINFLVSLIDILILSLRMSKEMEFDLDFIFQPFEEIIEIATKGTNPIAVVKSTVALKSYLLYCPKKCNNEQILREVFKVMDRLLNPKESEVLSTYIGNIVMVMMENISNPKINMELLKRTIAKVRKCSLPSTLQGIALLFSRYINKSPKDMIKFLANLSVENRSALKILMDRWLLHQPKFIGPLTKNTTYKALMCLLIERDPAIENLLVLGFDPSHTKASPEITTPLKILSTIVRCVDNELKVENKDLKVRLRINPSPRIS